MRQPARQFGIDEFRAQLRHARLGVPRVDAAGRHFTAVYGLHRQEADSILAFLTDDGVGGPSQVMAGGWKTHFFLEGQFLNGDSFCVCVSYHAKYWRCGEYTLGDQLVHPGLLEHLKAYTDPA